MDPGGSGPPTQPASAGELRKLVELAGGSVGLGVLLSPSGPSWEWSLGDLVVRHATISLSPCSPGAPTECLHPRSLLCHTRIAPSIWVDILGSARSYATGSFRGSRALGRLESLGGHGYPVWLPGSCSLGHVCLPGGEPELHHRGELAGPAKAGLVSVLLPRAGVGVGVEGSPCSEDAPWQRPEDTCWCWPLAGELGIYFLIFIFLKIFYLFM